MGGTTGNNIYFCHLMTSESKKKYLNRRLTLAWYLSHVGVWLICMHLFCRFCKCFYLKLFLWKSIKISINVCTVTNVVLFFMFLETWIKRATLYTKIFVKMTVIKILEILKSFLLWPISRSLHIISKHFCWLAMKEQSKIKMSAFTVAVG